MKTITSSITTHVAVMNMIIPVTGVVLSIGVAKWESYKTRMMYDERRHLQLVEEMNKDKHMHRYNTWAPRLINMTEHQAIAFGATLTENEQKEVHKLLDLYFKHPCMEILKLNFKGDGCESVFRTSLSNVTFLNNLLYCAIGFKNQNTETLRDYLSNYERLAAIIVKNETLNKPCKYHTLKNSKRLYHPMLIDADKLYMLRLKKVGKQQSCNM